MKEWKSDPHGSVGVWNKGEDKAVGTGHSFTCSASIHEAICKVSDTG